MASRKEGFKSLFSNTRSRVIILFTVVLIIIATIIGFTKLKIAHRYGAASTASVSSVPGGIQSIPGTLNPTAQYAKLQEVQNVTQAQTAIKSGGSAIPTIIRTQGVGDGAQVIGGPGGLGFSTLAQESNAGPPHSPWLDMLRNSHCNQISLTNAIHQGATLTDLKSVCTCVQLKASYKLDQLQKVCSCKELKMAGFNARQLKDDGDSALQLRLCGFDACELRNAGFTAQQMKAAGFSDGELRGAGFSAQEIAGASGLPEGINKSDICGINCQSSEELQRLNTAGVSASAIRRIGGCGALTLKSAGYGLVDLKNAGFNAAELKNAGYLPGPLRSAGFSITDLFNAGFLADDLVKAGFMPTQVTTAQTTLPPGVLPADISSAGCDATTLKRENLIGISLALIRHYSGCSADAFNAAGLTDLTKRPDCSLATLTAVKAAGASPVTIAQTLGCGADELKAAGFNSAEAKEAGFTAAELKNGGFDLGALKSAGFTADDLQDICVSDADLKRLGYNLSNPNISSENPAVPASALSTSTQTVPSAIAVVTAGSNATQFQPPFSGVIGATSASPNNAQLQALLNKQNQQMADQRYQQRIQQRSASLLSAATEALQNWEKTSTQVYLAGNDVDIKGNTVIEGGEGGTVTTTGVVSSSTEIVTTNKNAIIKTGDILFAVLDTSVDSDEPGPILATIVSGRLKGTRLIGSFVLPNNAEKMVITFNTMSVPGAAGSTSINAYAIDPNTARTALASSVDHHYLLRYGSLFASSFMQGVGNAVQSADTTVTIGGTGGGQNITVQQGIGRSTLQNAIIGLATVGQNWGQFAQQLFTTPITVKLCSGTAIGVLFTQDLTSI